MSKLSCSEMRLVTEGPAGEEKGLGWLLGTGLVPCRFGRIAGRLEIVLAESPIHVFDAKRAVGVSQSTTQLSLRQEDIYGNTNVTELTSDLYPGSSRGRANL